MIPPPGPGLVPEHRGAGERRDSPDRQAAALVPGAVADHRRTGQGDPAAPEYGAAGSCGVPGHRRVDQGQRGVVGVAAIEAVVVDRPSDVEENLAAGGVEAQRRAVQRHSSELVEEAPGVNGGVAADGRGVQRDDASVGEDPAGDTVRAAVPRHRRLVQGQPAAASVRRHRVEDASAGAVVDAGVGGHGGAVQRDVPSAVPDTAAEALVGREEAGVGEAVGDGDVGDGDGGTGDGHDGADVVPVERGRPTRQGEVLGDPEVALADPLDGKGVTRLRIVDRRLEIGTGTGHGDRGRMCRSNAGESRDEQARCCRPRPQHGTLHEPDRPLRSPVRCSVLTCRPSVLCVHAHSEGLLSDGERWSPRCHRPARVHRLARREPSQIPPSPPTAQGSRYPCTTAACWCERPVVRARRRGGRRPPIRAVSGCGGRRPRCRRCTSPTRRPPPRAWPRRPGPGTAAPW